MLLNRRRAALVVWVAVVLAVAAVMKLMRRRMVTRRRAEEVDGRPRAPLIQTRSTCVFVGVMFVRVGQLISRGKGLRVGVVCFSIPR